MCKFLVQLSMDFSSYYNRVHVLGVRAGRGVWAGRGGAGEPRPAGPLSPQEPRPHLFGQMLARLQLLRAVQEVLHAGLATLGLPPLSHV